MAVTYTTAAERDHQRTRHPADRFDLAHLSLAVTSGVALLAILLAYAGRISVFESAESTRAGARTVNLNTVEDPARLESAFETVFRDVSARQFASRELFRFLIDQRREGRTLPNVGAIARTNVNGTPVLTASDISALKPFLTVRTPGEFRLQVLLYGLAYVLAFHLVSLVWWLRGIRGDRLLLAVAHLLTAIGFAVLLSRPDPVRDSLLFVRFAEGTIVGLLVMTALSLIEFGGTRFVEFSYLPLAGALSLSVVLILFGSGPGSSNAKVNVGPLQPIEAIRLLLALFLAGYFARRWELLQRASQQGRPGCSGCPNGSICRAASTPCPCWLASAWRCCSFFFRRIWGRPCFSVVCFWRSTPSRAAGWEWPIAGLVLLVLGFYAGYRLHISSTLADRVRMWQSPWDNAVAGGDQLTRAIWGMATGGWFGTGLGLGDSRYLPAGHTDLVLAAIGEELGAVGLTLVAALYAVVAWRGICIGRLARNDYGFFLATALTLFLIVPALIMASGILGVTPLTGVVTPFLSYGGSAMVANFGALGMLAALHADRSPAADFEPFRVPMHWLGGTLGLCALVLLAVMIDIQIVRADDYVARPHLGVQADGGRRFEYNPRVLDMVRLMPRGTIYDRQGVPLATDDPAVIASARPVYAKLGVSIGGRVSECRRTMLPAGRQGLPCARRRADKNQLERAQYLVHRARCRRSLARLR